MARTESLTKQEVVNSLAAWGAGSLSDQDIYAWADSNYFPVHQEVAPGEHNNVALAIGVILTEFETSKPPYRFNRGIANKFIELILTPPDGLGEIRKRTSDLIASHPN